MENYEQEFLSDVLSAVSDWRCSYDDYYESDYSYNYYRIGRMILKLFSIQLIEFVRNGTMLVMTIGITFSN